MCFTKKNVLAKKVLLSILFFSSCLTLLTTLSQLYNDYLNDIENIKKNFISIESSHLASLSANLWDFNELIVHQQLKGIVNLPGISFAQITTPLLQKFESGTQVTHNVESHQYPLIYLGDEIGVLTITANLEQIYNRLWSKAAVIFIGQFIKTLIIASIIIGIVYFFVSRHLNAIANYSNRLTLENLAEPLLLQGNRREKDELDVLVDSINSMRKKLIEDNEKLQAAKIYEQTINETLEQQVKQRTIDLENTVVSLKDTQDALVLAEKMASLGRLVAGLSHEISTPLGICVTSSSSLHHAVSLFTDLIKENRISRSKLTSFIETLNHSINITDKALTRATELTSNFKLIAVHQSHDTPTECDMDKYIREVVSTVSTLFKKNNYEININISFCQPVKTYLGTWSQIITNLLMNSHIHGFEAFHKGIIDIEFYQEQEHYVFRYRDNGRGIREDIIDNIFEPFITTRRGEGGSGLGMNILYNLVSTVLKGKVSVRNLEQGCVFEIVIPESEFLSSSSQKLSIHNA